jgi:polyphosphate kinase
VEATCPVFDQDIKKVLKNILEIQLSDNVKARILDNDLNNKYVRSNPDRKIRSQIEIYNYLQQKTLNKLEAASQEINPPPVAVEQVS